MSGSDIAIILAGILGVGGVGALANHLSRYRTTRQGSIDTQTWTLVNELQSERTSQAAIIAELQARDARQSQMLAELTTDGVSMRSQLTTMTASLAVVQQDARVSAERGAADRDRYGQHIGELQTEVRRLHIEIEQHAAARAADAQRIEELEREVAELRGLLARHSIPVTTEPAGDGGVED